MGKRLFYRFVLIGIELFIIASISTSVFGEVRKKQAWSTPESISKLLSQMDIDSDSTLIPPVLFDEPAYTLGRENTLHWSSTESHDRLNSDTSGLSILFFEIEAYSDSTGFLWGFVDVNVDSATFYNLPSGISIAYRLRYYAGDNNGNYGRSLWSNTKKSIQDISPPLLEYCEIIDLKSSGGKNWVNSKAIDINIKASDPDSGQVMQVVFEEMSSTSENVLFYDIEPPEEAIDMTIPYHLSVPENELVTMRIWVVDVAGQVSSSWSIIFFWWEMEKIVCFPNPFNPQRGEIATIELNNDNIEEARIYDPFGNLVRILKKGQSTTFFEWDGKNDRGDIVSNGGYICVISGETQHYCKIAVLR